MPGCTQFRHVWKADLLNQTNQQLQSESIWVTLSNCITITAAGDSVDCRSKKYMTLSNKNICIICSAQVSCPNPPGKSHSATSSMSAVISFLKSLGVNSIFSAFCIFSPRCTWTRHTYLLPIQYNVTFVSYCIINPFFVINSKWSWKIIS